MFSRTGIAPLATTPQITSKVRLINTRLDPLNARRPSQNEIDDSGRGLRRSTGYPQITQIYAVIYVICVIGFGMNTANLFVELVATYRKHGWELRSVLMQPSTLAEFRSQEAELLSEVPVKEAGFDALWFSRPSHDNREAWELRLLAQTQYALFETFEADETEEERDDLKLEMEARLRDYLSGKQ